METMFQDICSKVLGLTIIDKRQKEQIENREKQYEHLEKFQCVVRWCGQVQAAKPRKHEHNLQRFGPTNLSYQSFFRFFSTAAKNVYSFNKYLCTYVVHIQGGSNKMSHKDFLLKSVLGVRFYFPICVLALEFRARVI